MGLYINQYTYIPLTSLHYFLFYRVYTGMKMGAHVSGLQTPHPYFYIATYLKKVV